MEISNINYNSYLKIEKLLNLQHPQSPGPVHEEMLFIIIHQIYELWFKEIIFDIQLITKYLQKESESTLLIPLMEKINNIFSILIDQSHILKSITPIKFAEFRKYLGTASGLQSKQFKEIGRLLGLKKDNIILTVDNLNNQNEEKNLWILSLEYILNCIKNENPSWESLIKKQFPCIENTINLMLLYAYQYLPQIHILLEQIITLDEKIQHWRYCHIQIVKRTIGFETDGTGGSSGMQYLNNGLRESFCFQLWDIRNLISKYC